MRYKGDIALFRRPAVRPRFAFRKNVLLDIFRQSNIAVAMAVDVHEHCPSDKESIFVNARILALRHTG